MDHYGLGQTPDGMTFYPNDPTGTSYRLTHDRKRTNEQISNDQAMAGDYMYPNVASSSARPQLQRLRNLNPESAQQYPVSHIPMPRPSKTVNFFSKRRFSRSSHPDITRWNAENSPFLRLPPEIRNRIYEYALSNQVLHFSVRHAHKSDPGAFPDEWFNPANHIRIIHTTCHLAPDTEDEVYRQVSRPQPSLSSDTTTYESRHNACYSDLLALKSAYGYDGLPTSPSITTSTAPRPPVPPPYPVAFLRTCRQIHSETALIPYSTNTLAFHEPPTFHLLLRSCLLPAQRQLIPRLQLDACSFGNHYYIPWRLDKQLIRSLKGLEDIYCAVSRSVETMLVELDRETGEGAKGPLDAFARLKVRRRVVIEGVEGMQTVRNGQAWLSAILVKARRRWEG